MPEYELQKAILYEVTSNTSYPTSRRDRLSDYSKIKQVKLHVSHQWRILLDGTEVYSF